MFNLEISSSLECEVSWDMFKSANVQPTKSFFSIEQVTVKIDSHLMFFFIKYAISGIKIVVSAYY